MPLTFHCIAHFASDRIALFLFVFKMVYCSQEKNAISKNFASEMNLTIGSGLVISLPVSEDLKSSVSFESCQFNRSLRIYRGVGLFMTFRSRSRRASSKTEGKGKYHS